ncbi:hypothetical protein [Aliivibrio fischeri]|uniref:Uncharacterized protein n=1 Tax=Aliivibrio fischeri TaxID=668 RepID=A0A510UJB5_ALIFS|nr:hypothetical protein [Aliivibrio fischeri]GEK13025.1 hypothetical protein AFI02nite_10610 [Aliivibrio fischeri]
MRITNSTFRGGEPSWANACVRSNGSPSYVEYAKGFSKAANLIIDQALDYESVHFHVDDMVYPACFNMRHSVELRLKGVIEDLEVIAKWKGRRIEFDLVGSHDVGNIWEFFKRESEALDIRYQSINEKIEPTILDIADVDATGQTFRYPVDRDSRKHLIEVAIINFNVLKAKFTSLEKELDNLLFLTEFLREEYSLNTFTTKLSRKELFFLAGKLPNITSWRNDTFKETKKKLMEQFSLGSRDLSKAIDLIKSNYELSHKIGSRLPLKGIDEYDLIWFLDFWMELNPEILSRKNHTSGLAELDVDSMLDSLERDAKVKEKFWDNLNGYLTPESLAGLNAIFYFARDKKFSERYVTFYENELQESTMHFNECVWSSFMHMADKTNFFDNLVMSLFFLHYDDLAEELIDIYGVSDAFNWLDKARTRELFSLPGLAGY